jgi:hypothetical protein
MIELLEVVLMLGLGGAERGGTIGRMLLRFLIG